MGVAALSFMGGERSNKAMAQQAARQIDFQQAMSNTAYQRATNDMRKAGLNPMLAAIKGGASTPIGAMANVQDTISPALASGRDQARTDSDTNLTDAKTVLTETENTLKLKDVPLATIKAKLMNHVKDIVTLGERLILEKNPAYKPVILALRKSLGETIRKGNQIDPKFQSEAMQNTKTRQGSKAPSRTPTFKSPK